MTAEKKEKPAEKCERVICKPHSFVVTGWMRKGGNQSATQMRCTHCLLAVCLEELQSKEWKESQGM